MRLPRPPRRRPPQHTLPTAALAAPHALVAMRSRYGANHSSHAPVDALAAGAGARWQRSRRWRGELRVADSVSDRQAKHTLLQPHQLGRWMRYRHHKHRSAACVSHTPPLAPAPPRTAHVARRGLGKQHGVPARARKVDERQQARGRVVGCGAAAGVRVRVGRALAERVDAVPAGRGGQRGGCVGRDEHGGCDMLRVMAATGLPAALPHRARTSRRICRRAGGTRSS